MFMHYGSNESFGVVSNLRGFPWHVHTFFTLAGFVMSAPLNHKIERKIKYIKARIGSMYALYFLAIICGLANLLVSCRPSSFRTNFTFHAKENDLYEFGDRSGLFCEGAPSFPNSYWASLISTIVIYIFGLTITPFWSLHWWLGYYLWFISMYFQCVLIYPSFYNMLYNLRGQKKRLVVFASFLVATSLMIVAASWVITKDKDGFHTEHITSNDIDSDDWIHNAVVLSFYLFSPFWMIYFMIGMVCAFIYDAYRPSESHYKERFGFLADFCTLFIFSLSLVQIYQGSIKNETDEWFFRPDEANNPFSDVASTNRLWDNIYGRLMSPLTALWIYSLSTGEGLTAKFLKNRILVLKLAPYSYCCFLFHQMVGQWYFALTRGKWWNWWNYRKTMYWFSPKPLPIEWYEYPYLILLVIWFSIFVTDHIQPKLTVWFTFRSHAVQEEDLDSETMLLKVIENLSGVEAQVSNTVEECGITSIGMPVLEGMVNKYLAMNDEDAEIDISEMIQAKTIGDLVDVIDAARARATDNGI